MKERDRPGTIGNYRGNQRLTRAIRRNLPFRFFVARPHPNPLPQEREQLSSVSGCDETRRAIPVVGILIVRRTILPLLEERDGVRTSDTTDSLHMREGTVYARHTGFVCLQRTCLRASYLLLYHH